MSIYDQIAAGVAPIGRDLPQIANLLEQRNRWQQLQKYQRDRDDEDRTLRDAARKRQEGLDAKAEEVDTAKRTFVSAQWVAASPTPKKSAAARFPKEVEQLKQEGFDWDNADDEAVRVLARRLMEQYGPIAGIAPKEAPGEIELKDLGRGVQAVVQDGNVVGSPQYPQRPPQAGPETYDDFTDAEGNVHLIGNRGTIRDTPLKGQLNAGRDRPSDTGMKASDSNSIVSAAARAFGGVYDPLSGNISGLRQEDLLNLNRVASRASELFLENNGQVPHATAVQRALEEFRGGGNPTGGAPGRNPPARRRPDFTSEQDAQTALERGQLKVGDTVYINGKPAFRVE